ncbi:unnamed protein product [Lathyrus oleraceus]
MAMSINRVYFFFAILCITSVITTSGESQSIPWNYCYGKGPCPGNDALCADICKATKGFHLGGKCGWTGLCCCRGCC